MTVLSLFLLQTFLILSTRFGRQYVFRFSKEKSLFLFGPLNVVRKAIIILITNQYPFSVTSTNGVNYLINLAQKIKPQNRPHVRVDPPLLLEL